MGIYSSGEIYGIKIYFIEEYKEDILFEIKKDIRMSDEERKEAKIFYNGLCEKDNTKVRFEIYTEFSSTYNNEVGIMWESVTFDFFKKNFDI